MYKINVVKTFKANYEDDSYWVEYEVKKEGRDFTGYELVMGKQSIEELEKAFNSYPVLNSNAIEKVEDIYLNEELASLICDCLASEDEMLCVYWEELWDRFDTEGDIDEWISNIQQESKEWRLDKYIEFDEEERIIIIYGIIATKVLFAMEWF